MEHHARVIFSSNLSLSDLPSDVIQSSIDNQHIKLDKFGIDDAHQLIKRSQSRPWTDGRFTFVIITKKLTEEAQGALLKLFESPPDQVCFCLMVRYESDLLPTLLSRLEIHSPVDKKTKSKEEIESFFSLPYSDRLSLIAKKTKIKDVDWTNQIIHDALRRPEIKRSTALLIDRFSRQKGASHKMLLEMIALN